MQVDWLRMLPRAVGPLHGALLSPPTAFQA